MLADLVEDLRELRIAGVLRGQPPGPGRHLIGDQQFAHRVHQHLTGHRCGDGALVTDREHPDLADLIAPEVHTHGHLRCRREDVEQSTTGGELAAPADHVGMGVAELHQTFLQLTEIDLRALDQAYRLHLSDAGHHRLHHRARRRHQHLDLALCQPVQRGPTLGDGLHTRRQPLMRQRLPRRHQGHDVPQHRGQFRSEVLGLTSGRGDHQHRGFACQRRHGERPGRVGPLDMQAGLPHVRQKSDEFRVGCDGVEDAGQGCRARDAHGYPS